MPPRFLRLDPKEKGLIERQLIDLKMARALLKIKGEKPRLLKIPFVSPIQVSDEALDRVKMASFRRWAKPVAEVEKEIEARRSLWQSGQAAVTVRELEIKPQEQDRESFTPGKIFEEGQNEW